MFNFLKDKLKAWVGKAKEEPKEIEEIDVSEKKKGKKQQKEKAKVSKKEKGKKDKKPGKKEKIKFVEPIQDFNAGTLNTEPNIEKTQELVESKEKKSFWNFLKKKDQHDVGESLLKDTDKELAKELYEHASDSSEQKLEKSNKQEEPQEVQEEKTSFFDKFKTKLTEEKFEELFSELEMILLQNNVSLEVVDEMKKYLKDHLIGKTLKEIDLEEKLKEAIALVLKDSPDFLREIKLSLTQKQPFVIAFVGINGSGKTTTIAKVANLLKKNKISVVLAAADTFRAAAIQQLEEHASRLQLPIVKKDYGADPASVGFDAIAYAKKHHIDVVLIDTAGRMNTKDSLMKEMGKIIRVCKPDMKIFIGESITGNDATQQARDFNSSIDLTGIILSKADVDEKGGSMLSVSYITKKPILFLGTGQTYDDLEPFKKNEAIKKLGL